MTDPGFEWRSPEERTEELQRQDPLKLRAQPPSPLLLPADSAPALQAPAQVTPQLLERVSVQSQKALTSPVLQAAGMDRADAEQRSQERASTTARVAQLRDGLPENALEDAQARMQARRNPQAPDYFSTPAERRPAGSHPSASDWVGLYAYEMHVQQQLAGGRGIESRRAADIQRRAATGLGYTYGDYTEAGVAPEERNRDFGGHLAALGEAPFGSQVNHVILSRLPRGDRPGVQAALLGAQQERAVLAQQDRRALDAQALESRLATPEGPLSGRIPPGTPPEVQAQLKLGLNAGPGGFEQAGMALPDARSAGGGTQVQVRSRREGGSTPAPGGATPGGISPGSTGPQGSAPKTATTAPGSTGGVSAPGTKDQKAVAQKQGVQTDEKAAKDKVKAKTKAPRALGSGSKDQAGRQVAARKGSKGTRDAQGAQGKTRGASTGVAAPSAGGAGGGGPSALRAVPIAQVPKNLNAQPIMQMDGQALFDEAQWKKLTAPLDRAGPGKAPQATQASPVISGFTTPTPGITAPRRAAAPRKSPLGKLGHTISAAEIKKAEAKARKDAQSEMSGFVTRAGAKVRKLDSAKKAIAPKVQGAAKSAQARIAGAARTATGQVNAAAAQATARAQAAAAQARAKINAEFSSTVSAIKAGTKSSQTALEAAHKAAVQVITSGLTGLNTSTRAEFTTAQGRARTIASTEANAASALGNQRAAAYAAEPLEHQSGWEDFVNGDDYPAKKRDAKVQAARSVGQGYHDELLKSGGDYAAKLPEGAGKVEEGNQKLHDEHIKSLDQQLTQNIQALHQAETQAIQSATTAKTQQLAAVAQQLSSALSGIAQQKSGLAGQISQQAASQKSAISKAASSGVSGLQQAATTAISGLNKQITGIQGQMKGKGVPDVQALKVSLKGADAQIAGGITAAQNSISGGAQKTASGLTGQGATSASGLLATASKGAQGINQAGTQAATSANQVATSAATLFKNLAKGHEQGLKTLTSKAKQNTTAVQKSFTDNGKKVVESVKDQLQKATDSFQGEMQKARAGEDAKITEEAEKAASKVQPRWKGWVSIVIDIVIAVAVTALVIATGGVAGIVLGIVLGAVGGVLGQLAKDGLNGELSDWKTYAAAAVGGAIGGALGAGGGALSGLAAKAVSKQLVSFGVKEGLATVAKVGVDFVGNNITGLVSQTVAGFVNNKAFGTPFNIADVFSVKNLAQNALMTGVGMGAGKYFEHNPGVPNALRGMMNKVPGVNISAPAPHVNTPENTGVGKPELNAGGSEVTGVKTNVNVETPGGKAPTGGKSTTETNTGGNPPEAAAGGGGKEPPKPPSNRDAPPASEPPRPEGNNSQPRKALPPGKEPLALPPAPERLALPPGKGSTETETVSSKAAEGQTSGEPTTQPRLNEPPKGGNQEPQGSQPPKRSGRETGEAGKAFEEQVQRETGGKSEVIEGREIDAVTDEALIQAKDVKTDNPRNFLNKKTRAQIKETVRMAGEHGKRAEFHFKDEPHPDVVKYIEERGGYVVSPGRPRPAPGTPPRTPTVEPRTSTESQQTKKGGPEENGPNLDEGGTPVTPTKPKGPVGPEGGAAGALRPTETAPVQDAPTSDPGLSERGYQPQPGERSTTKQEWQAQEHARRIAARQERALQETNAIIERELAAIPEGPQKAEVQRLLQQVENLDFGTIKDQASFYSGRKNGLSNRELALEHMERGGSAIDGTPGGKYLESLKLYDTFAEDTRLADLVWKKASQMYARGAEGDVHLFVDGADPTRVYGTIERPLIEGNPNVGKWKQYENPGLKTPEAVAPTTEPTAPLHSPEELSAALPEQLRGKVPLQVNSDLNGNTVRVRYEHENGVIKSVKLEVGPEATPRDIELHAQTVQTMQKYMGLQGRVRSALDSLKRLVGLDGQPKLGTKAWEAKLELTKLDAIIQDRQNALMASEDPAVRARLEAELAGLDLQVKLHEDTLARMDGDPGAGYVAADNLTYRDLESVLTRLLGKGKRPSNFSTDTLEALFGRQPELHDGNARALDHNTSLGKLSRNHIIGFLHERTLALNELVGRTHDDMMARMESKGFKPGDTSDAALEQALIDYLKARYNVDHNLYVGVSGDNSSLGSLMRHARDRRARIDPQADPVAFRTASRELAEMAVDVPEGKAAADGGQALTTSERRAIRQVRDIEAQWEDIVHLREEGRRLREGDLEFDNSSKTFQDATKWRNDLRDAIEQLVAKAHTGTPETNASIREALTQAVQIELLLSEVLNGL